MKKKGAEKGFSKKPNPESVTVSIKIPSAKSRALAHAPPPLPSPQLLHLHNSLRHPLNSQAGPGQGMRVQGIIEKRRVLLPYLVLLHHFLLFDVIGIFDCRAG